MCHLSTVQLLTKGKESYTQMAIWCQVARRYQNIQFKYPQTLIFFFFVLNFKTTAHTLAR